MQDKNVLYSHIIFLTVIKIKNPFPNGFLLGFYLKGTSKNSFFFVIKNQNTLKSFRKLIKIFPIFNF